MKDTIIQIIIGNREIRDEYGIRKEDIIFGLSKSGVLYSLFNSEWEKVAESPLKLKTISK